MSEFFARQASTDARLLKRSCESLLGIAAGLLADKELSDKEISFLDVWLSENSDIANAWPGEIVCQRVRDILSDGKITEEERLYLRSSLEQLIGGDFEETGSAGGLSTSLPLDNIDAVEIAGRSFCFTGQFLYGTRAACQRAIEKRGGQVGKGVRKDLDYLVIGTLSSREWANTSYGRKIEKAVQYKQKGCALLIISEDQWNLAL